jgi:hypothetical protein
MSAKAGRSFAELDAGDTLPDRYGSRSSRRSGEHNGTCDNGADDPPREWDGNPRCGSGQGAGTSKAGASRQHSETPAGRPDQASAVAPCAHLLSGRKQARAELRGGLGRRVHRLGGSTNMAVSAP